jgi:serine/threonine-protein kinase HipA
VAQLLWGKVYYQDVFAGYLRQEPGERFVFTYDGSYLNSSNPSISYTMPLRSQPYVSEYGLHPFFDNLVSEGWLENAQARLIGKRMWSRFELLLAFGMDLAGAVSILDPELLKFKVTASNAYDRKTLAVMQGRASLSGIQPKLTLIKEKSNFRPSHREELSTYIGKFPSPHLPDIIENEYLTTLACKRLFPEDEFVDLCIDSVEGISEKALLIKRFDRTPQGQRIHFEEFNQLLEKQSRNKYEGAYKDMADFLNQNNNSIPLDIVRLFNRIIMGIAVGNTDMHFKNFALIYKNQGMRLSPNYDLVSAAAYHPSYQAMALRIGGAQDLPIHSLKPKNILSLAKEFGISKQAIQFTMEQLKKNIPHAKEAVFAASFGTPSLKDQIIKQMDKRWNGTFSLIGKLLLEKQ